MTNQPEIVLKEVTEQLDMGGEHVADPAVAVASWIAQAEAYQTQLRLVDEVLARRPAIADCKNRYDAIERACTLAGQVDGLQQEITKLNSNARYWKSIAEERLDYCNETAEELRLAYKAIQALKVQTEIGRCPITKEVTGYELVIKRALAKLKKEEESRNGTPK